MSAIPSTCVPCLRGAQRTFDGVWHYSEAPKNIAEAVIAKKQAVLTVFELIG